MISQAELENAIAQYKARQAGEAPPPEVAEPAAEGSFEGAAVAAEEAVAVEDAVAVEEAVAIEGAVAGEAEEQLSYPAEVEVGYEGAVTPVPADGAQQEELPAEAYRSDTEMAALEHQEQHEATTAEGEAYSSPVPEAQEPPADYDEMPATPPPEVVAQPDQEGYFEGAAIPRGNDEPTMVPDSAMDLIAQQEKAEGEDDENS